AATRARDLLVVPAVGDEPYAEGWVSPLNAAIYPAEHIRRQPSSAAGCPTFKSKDTVLERPDGDPATMRTVCPGEHRFGGGEQVAGDIARPGGIRFGTLVHALLADVPLAPGDDLLDRLAAAHGRVLGAEPEEIAAAAAVVRRVLGHPMMRDAARAAGQNRCYR